MRNIWKYIAIVISWIAFSVSLTKCWASNTALAATDESAASGAWYGDTSTSAAGEFTFFDSFCSSYPSWVSPNPATNGGEYLKEKWDGSTSLHAVHFRQFGFQADQQNYVDGTSNEVFYHCFVKVCAKTSEATCSTTTVKITPHLLRTQLLLNISLEVGLITTEISYLQNYVLFIFVTVLELFKNRVWIN